MTNKETLGCVQEMREQSYAIAYSRAVAMLERNTQRGPTDECWPWMASRATYGYGTARGYRNGVVAQFRAHRLALALAASFALSACSDTDWSRSMNFVGLDDPQKAEPAQPPVVAQAVPSPAQPARASAVNPFCIPVSTQDSERNAFQPAPQAGVDGRDGRRGTAPGDAFEERGLGVGQAAGPWAKSRLDRHSMARHVY